MFCAPDHRYDRAVPGSFRLVPTADMRKKLATEYGRMSAMIFAMPPDFEAIMKSISPGSSVQTSGAAGDHLFVAQQRKKGKDSSSIPGSHQPVPRRKSLPREEVRQAFEKNRTTDGRRSAAVLTDAPWEEEWAV